MKYLEQGFFGLCLLSAATCALSDETVKTPRGWDEQVIEQVREVGNGNATVRILPWQSLRGKSIEQWLADLQNEDPQGGVLLSTDGVIQDSLPGTFSVNRKATFDGQEGVAVLYGCPGQPGHARLISIDVKDGGLFDLVKGAKFGEKVCRQEPQGSGSEAGVAVITSGNQEAERSSASASTAPDSSVEPDGSDLSDAENNRLASITEELPDKRVADTGSQQGSSVVSQTDTTATLNAVASGLNPNLAVIPATFTCYDNTLNNADDPLGTFIVDGDYVTVIFGDRDPMKGALRESDEEGRVYIGDGDSPFLIFDIEFNEYGQILTSPVRRSRLSGCYQDGAAQEAILHQVMLNTPEPGEFSCITATSTIQSTIELVDGERYRAQGKTGTYQYGKVFSSNSSEIYFKTGPLQSSEANYSEDPISGLQMLEFKKTDSQVFLNGTGTSSVKVSAQCTKKSVPKPYKRYGKLNAPEPTAPKRSIEGIYFIDNSYLTYETRSDRADYIEFDSRGYVYAGTPLPGGTDCSLTLPNGLPLCKQYQFDGTTLSILTPWGDMDEAKVRINKDGSLRSIETVESETVQLEAMTAVDPAMVVGSWKTQEVRSSGVSACIVGMCNTSIRDRQYILREDGQYLSTDGSQSNSSFDTGILASYANGSNSDKSTGTYLVKGNTIELSMRDGGVAELPIYLTKKGKLAIGDAQYTK